MAAVRFSSSTRRRQAVQGEPQPVATERVGHDDLRAGVEVAALDPPDDLRLGQVPDLGRVAELQAVREQHRAHRAVGHDRATALEELAEAGAGGAAVDGQAGRAVGERGGIDRRQRLGAARGGRRSLRGQGRRCGHGVVGHPSDHDTQRDEPTRRMGSRL